MANRTEHPERYTWWLNELESLGIDTKKDKNALKDRKEASDLSEDIKQILYEEYKAAYDEK
jgi:hypothetical protein